MVIERKQATHGLWTSNSSITAPEGALLVADNIVIRQVGKIEPARGWAPYKTAVTVGARVFHSMFEYQGMLYLSRLNHNDGSVTLYYDPSTLVEYSALAAFFSFGSSSVGTYSGSLTNGASGTFTSSDSLIAPTDKNTQNYFPIQGLESGKSLYLNDAQSVRRLDATAGSHVTAGVQKGSHVSTSARSGDGTASTPGWITSYTNKIETVAYRIVWGYNDANKRLLLGAPSERFIHTTEQLPAISTLTRAATTATCTTASAHGLTTADVVTISDGDDTDWDGSYAVTVTGGTTFTFTVDGTETTPATDPDWQITRDVDITFGAPLQMRGATKYFVQIHRTARATYLINAASNDPGDEEALVVELPFDESSPVGFTWDATNEEVTYTDTIDDKLLGIRLYTNPSQQGILQENSRPPVAGVLGKYQDHIFYGNVVEPAVVELRLTSLTGWSAGTSTFNFNSSGLGSFGNQTYTAETAEDIGSNEFLLDTTSTLLSQKIENTARSLVRVINADAFVHAEYVSDFLDDPGKIRITFLDHLVTASVTPKHNIQVWANAATEGNTWLPNISTSGTPTSFDYTNRSNRFYFSKFQQGDSVPRANFFDVGKESDEILKIVEFEERAVIVTDNGLYTLTGRTEQSFSLSGDDLSMQVLAPKTIQPGDNNIFMLTKQGLALVTPSGQVQIISNDIKETVESYLNKPHLKDLAHAVYDHIEHEYLIWFPSDTPDAVNGLEDEYPLLNFDGFRYNMNTKTWSSVVKSATVSFIKPHDGLPYLALTPTGSGGSETSQIVIERRLFDNTDFKDEDGNAITYRVEWAPFTGGDVMVGKQFTRVLLGLESDTGITVGTLGFSNDNVYTEETVVFSTADTDFGLGNDHLVTPGSIVPQNLQRGRILNLSWEHALKEEDWAILYAGVEHKVTSTKVTQ
jgi:hypothetical protein